MKKCFAVLALVALTVHADAGVGVTVGANVRGVGFNRAFVGSGFGYGVGASRFFNSGLYGSSLYNQSALFAPSYNYCPPPVVVQQIPIYQQSYIQPVQTYVQPIVQQQPVYAQQTYAQPQQAVDYCPPVVAAQQTYQAQASVPIYNSVPVGYSAIPNYIPGAVFVPGHGWHHHHPHPHPTPPPTPTPGGTGS